MGVKGSGERFYLINENAVFLNGPSYTKSVNELKEEGVGNSTYVKKTDNRRKDIFFFPIFSISINGFLLVQRSIHCP